MNVPIRVRLTAWCAVLMSAVLLVLGCFLVLVLREDIRAEVDDDGRRASTAILEAAADEGLPALDDDRADDDADDDRAGDESFGAETAEEFRAAARSVLSPGDGAQLLNARGEVLLSHGAVARLPLRRPGSGSRAVAAGVTGAGADPAEPGPAVRPPFTAEPLGGDGSYRLVVTAPPGPGAGPVLVVAIALGRVEVVMHHVLTLLLAAAPVVLAATVGLAHAVTGKALRPVERMTSDARAIGAGHLDGRVAVPAARDETARLAVTLNEMLERIERGVREQRRVVADASHGLRTPIAVMRAELDVSLRDPALPRQAREVLASAQDEVDRLTRAVDNLLTAAAVEEGRLELLTVDLDLRSAVADTVRQLQALARSHDVTLLADGPPAQLRGDPHRLALALADLVENAVKFSPPGGRVEVRTWSRGDEVGVTVADEGPGVPLRDRDRLFDRFRRVDSARGHATGGSGLGLAISAEIAAAHGGRIWVEDRAGGGSAFLLAFPGLPRETTDPTVPAVPTATDRSSHG